MSRYRCLAYVNDRSPRYLVWWSVEWQVVDCRRLEAAADFSAAMREAIAASAGEGWIAEGAGDFGFVFLRRGAVRRLLMLTPRDPRNELRQSFDPFRT